MIYLKTNNRVILLHHVYLFNFINKPAVFSILRYGYRAKNHVRVQGEKKIMFVQLSRATNNLGKQFNGVSNRFFYYLIELHSTLIYLSNESSKLNNVVCSLKSI